MDELEDWLDLSQLSSGYSVTDSTGYQEQVFH